MSVQKAVYNDVWPSCCSTCQRHLEPGIGLLHKAMAVALLAWILALSSRSGLWSAQIPVSLGMGTLLERVCLHHAPLESVAPRLGD